MEIDLSSVWTIAALAFIALCVINQITLGLTWLGAHSNLFFERNILSKVDACFGKRALKSVQEDWQPEVVGGQQDDEIPDNESDFSRVCKVMDAVSDSDIQRAQELIFALEDPDTRKWRTFKGGNDLDHNMTLLHYFVATANEPLARALIDAGAQVNVSLDVSCAYKTDVFAIRNATPLLSAVSQQNLALVEMLLGAGAEVNAVDLEMKTPLMIAVEMDNKALVEALIKGGADVNYSFNEMSVLGGARSPMMCEVLRSSGVDISRSLQNGETVLNVAIRNFNTHVFNAVFELSAYYRNASPCRNPLFAAYYANNLYAFNALLPLARNPGQLVNEVELTLLECAVRDDAIPYVKALLDDKRVKIDHNLLFRVCSKDMQELLVIHGADPTVKRHGKTADDYFTERKIGAFLWVDLIERAPSIRQRNSLLGTPDADTDGNVVPAPQPRRM
ncbi:ankyrin repeat domain-containing protein [Stenotrophomonas rhizophila]|uniref:Ankyrin repeat protein n=1 Tax=Stenotrophomonas rhizophila TaxID=216778 RepID=A0A7V8CCC2_9GAMM|nr:ankyrin repeat domain-containing protein [Stenotrophomonas rhizophila]KAB7628882.1 hypothetical protein F9K92_15655 [Stenotrophomonas rhizophila]